MVRHVVLILGLIVLLSRNKAAVLGIKMITTLTAATVTNSTITITNNDAC